jgi:membrane-associated phospholipid phosphatase
MLGAAALTALALGILAVLVAAGALTGLDDFAVRRLMPGLYPYVGRDRVWAWSAHTIVQNPHRIVNRIADTVTRPANALPSLVILVGMLGLAIRARRTSMRSGAIWVGGFVVTLIVEQLGKYAITRPQLLLPWPGGVLPLMKFDHGFPSGHATRAILIAVVMASLLPRWPVRILPALWAAAVACLLVLAGTHALTDVFGGILLSATVALACAYLAPLGLARDRPLHLERAVADQVGDPAAGDQHRVDPGPLERQHLVAARRVDPCDRKLARGHVGQ